MHHPIAAVVVFVVILYVALRVGVWLLLLPFRPLFRRRGLVAIRFAGR